MNTISEFSSRPVDCRASVMPPTHLSTDSSDWQSCRRCLAILSICVCVSGSCRRTYFGFVLSVSVDSSKLGGFVHVRPWQLVLNCLATVIGVWGAYGAKYRNNG